MKKTPLPLLFALLSSSCATLRPIPELPPGAERKRPVLLVHGIDDSGRTMASMANALIEGGWTDLSLIDLEPNDGSLGVPGLAEQVDAHARALSERTGSPEIDVIAFSMGSLVSRYWLRRMDPSVKVKNFIAISGPHHGTLTGYFRWNEGATQMRPRSPLVQDLEGDEEAWGDVQVFSFWTPWDVMIFPASSSRLKGAIERTFPVPLHPLMLLDPRVQTAVKEALKGRLAPQRPLADLPRWP